ncbi:tripartite motif-containing protein 2 [Osmerus mordax]|uniref:tripartite motif-containing protein 2 n=1 Tax=Osmerus mordax TaxID=8014 RepID=UPI00350FFC72
MEDCRSPDSSSEECTVLEARPPKAATCPTHAGKVLEWYCTGCECAVCEVCVSGDHDDHPTLLLSEALQQQRAHLEERLGAAQSRLPQISQAVGSLREILHMLSSQRASIEEDISGSFQELHQALQLRQSVLMMELQITYTLKHQVLEAQLEALLQGEESISSSCAQAEAALGGEACQARMGSERGLGEVLGELASQGLPFQPEENDQLDLLMETQGLKKCIHNLGTIVTTSAVASQSEVTGEGLEQCIVGRPAAVTILTRDKVGGACKTGNAILSAEVYTPDGSVADGEIFDHKNGTYDFVYTVAKEGDFSLAVRLYDQHVTGSPFRLKVTLPPDPEGAKRRGKSPGTSSRRRTSRRTGSTLGTPRRRTNPIEDDLIYRIGTKGRNKGEFTNLQGVAACSGRILIADSNNQCVQIFSNEGEFKSRFGVRGRSPGQLQRPTGVAVHPNGDIIIADYDNKWVSIFSSEGKFKTKLGSGRLMGPKGVSVDQNGHVIVVDNKACTVFIFQPTGKLVTKFGNRGNGDKQFAGPHFAAVNNNNEIIVTDFHNHSVKVFSPEGELVLRFGSNGEGNGQFNAPTGVAVDVNGNIIVADWGNSRIQVFDGSGSFLSYINTSADPLYGPQGLALTSDGHVVVADSGNHCFKVYRYLQ